MGVEVNTYQIPPLVLGDTFYEWMNVTNTSIISKLNNIEAYSVTGGDGVSCDVNSSGLVELQIGATITKGITFSGPVVFDNSVTTINATNLTVDDYNLMLGHIDSGTGTADGNINALGGGGIIVKRLTGTPNATLLWSGLTSASGDPTLTNHGLGCSGEWTTTDYINLPVGVGLKSDEDILRFRTGTNATGSGFMATVATGPASGTSVTYNSSSMRLGHHATGSTGSAGLTYGIHLDEDGMVRIYDGVNKKLFKQTAHGLTFGNVVRLNSSGNCQFAHGNSKEDAEVFGIVSESIDANHFVVTMHGEIRGDFGTAMGNAGAGLTAGTVYFLNTNTGNSGEITHTEVTTAGKIRKPMVIGLGASAGYVLQYIGAKIAPEVDTVAPYLRRITVGPTGLKVSGSSDINCVKHNTGLYGVTHGFAGTSYSISILGLCADADSGGPMVAGIIDKGNNGFTFEMRKRSGGSRFDTTSEVILAKDTS